MTIKVGSNTQSLQAQRRLGDASYSLSTIFEKLASGQRITKASDDAAGLAIATDLNSKSRVYTQAVRNGNDGLSVLAIADAAIGSLTEIVARIRELSEQSANGTYESKQREALDNEAQALKNEFTRIAQSTEFNGIKLFDGSAGGGIRLQLGYGLEGSINASVGGAVGTGSFTNSFSTQTSDPNLTDLVSADFNGDGILDIAVAGFITGKIEVQLGMGDGSFVGFSSVQANPLNQSIVAGDINNDGNIDLVTSNNVFMGRGDGTFSDGISLFPVKSHALLADINNDGYQDIVSFTRGDYSFETSIGNGDGTFQQAKSHSINGSNLMAVKAGDLNGDGLTDVITVDYYGTVETFLSAGSGSFTVGVSMLFSGGGSFSVYDIETGDINGDGITDLSAVDYIGTTANIAIGKGNGTFNTIISAEVGERTFKMVQGDLNGDGKLDFVTSNAYGTTRSFLGSGDGGFTFLAEHDSGLFDPGIFVDANGDGVLDIIGVGGSNSRVLLAKTQAGIY